MPRRDALPNLHSVADLPTRQALKTHGDMVNAVRAEADVVRTASESTAREVGNLRSTVSRLGGLRPALKTLNTNVNIALDHPWFVLGRGADQAFTTGVADYIIFDRITLGRAGGDYYDVAAADGYVYLGRKPGLWTARLQVEWTADANGDRSISMIDNSLYYSVRCNQPAVATGRTFQSLAGLIPTRNPSGAGAEVLTRFRCSALQDSGSPLNLEGGGTGQEQVYLVCHYLGPFPA